MDGPGRAGFQATADFDRTVVDGAVNGVAGLVRGGGRGMRVLQSGYVRSYALGIGVGVVALLAYFLTRVTLGAPPSSLPRRTMRWRRRPSRRYPARPRPEQRRVGKEGVRQ